MALRIARGLFRLWLVLSVLWIGGVGVVTWWTFPEHELPSICDLPANERSEEWDCSLLARVKAQLVWIRNNVPLFCRPSFWRSYRQPSCWRSDRRWSGRSGAFGEEQRYGIAELGAQCKSTPWLNHTSTRWRAV